jgi:glycosyltransferase involved in cell wall biosynthesis
MALGRLGFEVTVHTCFPHYPAGRIIEPYRNRFYESENEAPVRVVRSAVYPTANRGMVRRLANHASFACSALATAPFTGPADVVVVESPPLFTAAAALPYAALKHAQLVVNVSDRWPASAVELGALQSPAAIRLAAVLERRCYRHAAAITVPTEGLAASLATVPQARGKVIRVPPAVDVERFRASPARGTAPLRILYAGTIGLAHGLATLVEAARLAGPKVVCVTIAGDGAEASVIARHVKEAAINNVSLLGSVPNDRIPALYEESDAAVVLLRDRPLFRDALPTKILEAMAAGRAVVISVAGEAARFVEEAGAGVAVEPENPEALAAAFRELESNPERLVRMGAAGRRHVEERFDRERMASDWIELLERVSGRSAGAPNA